MGIYTHCFHSWVAFKQQVSGKGVFSFENILNWIYYYSYVQCLQAGTETNMPVPQGRRKFDSNCGYSNWCLFHTIETGFWFGKNTDVSSLHSFFLFILKPDSSQTKQLSPILPRIVPGQETHSYTLWHQVLTHSTHGSARGRRAFPYAQNRILINPGHMCRSGALPLSVDNFITQVWEDRLGLRDAPVLTGGQCNERPVRTFKNEVTSEIRCES